MTDTTLTDPLRAAGASVINAMAEVQLLVLSLDPLWQGIGGRPVSIESAWSALDYQKRALAEAFDLALNPPETSDEEPEDPAE